MMSQIQTNEAWRCFNSGSNKPASWLQVYGLNQTVIQPFSQSTIQSILCSLYPIDAAVPIDNQAYLKMKTDSTW